ncbi:MAG: aminoglycoside phosphotransferase family protein [Nocardioidaceae bacterium]
MHGVGEPTEAQLAWVAQVLRVREVSVLAGMHDGGSPWLLRAGERPVVLRVGTPEHRGEYITERAALRLAAQSHAPAPRLLATSDSEGPLTLIEHLAGSSAIPANARPARLNALGATAARLHAVHLEPTAALPQRSRPISTEDFAKQRRERGTNALLHTAEERVARIHPVPASVFVHGDLWQGNTLWAGDTLVALLDWDCAGAGPPGVDLGSLRCDAALCYGPAAADHILTGWEQQTGIQASDVAYWDVTAALATPPDLGWFPAAISAQGRPDLTRPILKARRDAFLRNALARLPE